MKRRHFLQFTSSTVAALSLSNLNSYAQVLAQNTPRKLALLVGINKYPANPRYDNLNGCVTDVALQEELLVNRFGFKRQDIIKLTSDSPLEYQPTRQNILQMFEDHLIKQAKPGDVVVFHFSGHGSRILDTNPIRNCSNSEFNDNYNSTLVVPDELQNNLAPDIMGRTLFLLRSALNTDNVTMVLDSCYSGGGTRGNYVIRSVPGDNLKPMQEEIIYQERWMKQLKLTSEELAKQRCVGTGKGIVIASAKRDEEAADVNFDGFHAGAFTYLLTQYLWQETNTIGGTINQISDSVKRYGNTPYVDGNSKQPIYFINSKLTPSSDAVITKVEQSQITLWLGGVDADSLPTFQTDATFAAINNKGQSSGKLQLISPRNGLVATAKLIEPSNISIQPGTPLQELSRIVPGDLRLNIGIDSSLANEITAAKEALSKINRIQAVPAQIGNILYPNGVEYILSRMTANYQAKLRKHFKGNLPPINSIGLFSEGLDIIPESFNQPGETVSQAVTRLDAKLKSLLATLIIKKTLNANSSQLDVEVAMNLAEQPNKILARTATQQSKNNRTPTQPQKLPLNKLFQFRVTNNTSENLHLAILLVDTSGGLIVAYPYIWNVSDTQTLAPNQTLVVGEPSQLELQAVQKGAAEALIIVSRAPLKKGIKALQSLAQEQNRSSGALEINREPVEVISDLLDDVGVEPDRGLQVISAKEVKARDVASLSISFEVG
ncbi:MAG: caspase family protein [Scytonematopsis contorta HA4267-MV1]|jgi:hypothetical protein|nr:caspase family protein [Scytonematopsis contorta HA4267-MV1]